MNSNSAHSKVRKGNDYHFPILHAAPLFLMAHCSGGVTESSDGFGGEEKPLQMFL